MDSSAPPPGNKSAETALVSADARDVSVDLSPLPDGRVSGNADGPSLVSGLLGSHAAVVVPLALTLLVILFAVRHLAGIISEVADGELGAVRAEEVVHKAAWGLETAVRRATLRCITQGPAADMAPLAVPLAELDRAAKNLPSGSRFRAAIDRYEVLARELVADSSCPTLLAAPMRERRQQLEEELDDAWISRSVELHRATSLKEDEAGKVARLTLWLGVGMSVFALGFAAQRARKLAIAVTRPVSELGVATARIGAGDFRPLARPEHAPREISALFAQVEHMRQSLSELDALKQDFVASVSHELRTPLTKLREALALLVDGAGGPLSDRQARLVAIAQHACERQIDTIGILLDLSRLRAERARLPVVERAAGDVVAAALATVADEATARGVTLRTTGMTDVVVPVLPDLLRHALENLLRNAVSVSPAGATVTVDVVRDQQQLRFLVSDHGPGVPQGVKSTLFVPFSTEEVPFAGRPRGVGLGLAFSREVARAHGGDLWLASSDQSGACFALGVPLR